MAVGRDASLTRMLAVTLLPFLGLYAAFGQIDDAAGDLYTEQFFRNDDQWTVPQGQTSEQSLPSEAYYVIMRMPGEADPEMLEATLEVTAR